MKINYDTEKISAALTDFYNATGVEIELLKPDFSPVCEPRFENLGFCRAAQSTEMGRRACKLSDRLLLEACKSSGKTEMRVCHAGLLNVAIPLFYENTEIGYIIFGGIKESDELILDKELIQNSGLDSSELKRCYADIPRYLPEKIKSISNIAIMFAKYMLLKNMLKPSLGESLERLVSFIEENLGKEMSIDVISSENNVSKSNLYKLFHTHFSCTVSEYVNRKRIEAACELLKTNLSVEEISQRTGFSSAAYFSRNFKKHFGKSPSKYRKENLKNND